jgi:hypothetical protein
VSKALASIRAAIREAKHEHTCCEMFPEHFSLHDKPCPMPLFAGALDEAVKALELYEGVPDRDGNWGAEKALVRIASGLEGK